MAAYRCAGTLRPAGFSAGWPEMMNGEVEVSRQAG
jgi:hypothetical protein